MTNQISINKLTKPLVEVVVIDMAAIRGIIQPQHTKELLGVTCTRVSENDVPILCAQTNTARTC